MFAHSSEREKSNSEGDASKVETQKKGSKVFMLTSAKNQKKPFCEHRSTMTRQQQSTKSSTQDVNVGPITDTLPWYKFSLHNGIRVKPKLHRTLRIIYERLQKPSQKPKVFHTYIFLIWQVL